MIPGLGDRYKNQIDIEVIEKPKDDYMTDEYFEQDLPVAPAVMVADEIIVEGADVSLNKLEAALCRYLDLPDPVADKKGLVDRFFKR